MTINATFGWIGMLLGCLSGVLPGLMFHKENWLGGYSSWPRRMTRLGHVSFFGIGMLNLLFALAAPEFATPAAQRVASMSLLIGAVTMPLVCFAAAWKPVARHAFFLPAGSLVLGTLLIAKEVLS